MLYEFQNIFDVFWNSVLLGTLFKCRYETVEMTQFRIQIIWCLNEIIAWELKCSMRISTCIWLEIFSSGWFFGCLFILFISDIYLVVNSVTFRPFLQIYCRTRFLLTGFMRIRWSLDVFWHWLTSFSCKKIRLH